MNSSPQEATVCVSVLHLHFRDSKKLTFKIACTSAGTAHFRTTCGLRFVLKVILNKTDDNNTANFCTCYGDIYGELLFHKSY